MRSQAGLSDAPRCRSSWHEPLAFLFSFRLAYPIAQNAMRWMPACIEVPISTGCLAVSICHFSNSFFACKTNAKVIPHPCFRLLVLLVALIFCNQYLYRRCLLFPCIFWLESSHRFAGSGYKETPASLLSLLDCSS
ncbi:Uncharacterised protein [uncultured archaeon]|nr:Uncharacterised protein [uncultured archaeon]